jgi:adenylosuccinate synthase
MQKCLILSGRLCAGKTSLADELATRGSATILSARAVLRGLSPTPLESREALQSFGEAIEHRTAGRWLAEAVRTHISTCSLLVVDSVRTKAQLSSVKDVAGSSAFHAHLIASEHELLRRFQERTLSDLREARSFNEAMRHEIELVGDILGSCADLIIDTTRMSTAALAGLVLARLASGA